MMEHYFPALSVTGTLIGEAKGKKPYQILGKIAKKRNLRNPKCGGTQKRKGLALFRSKNERPFGRENNFGGH